MKANLSLNHGAFDPHFLAAGNAPDFRAIMGNIATQTRAALARLVKALQPVSREEAYLAESQNLAELERRMLELQVNHDRFSSSYW